MAKRFSQIYEQNCTDNFSLTISMTVIRSLFAIAEQHGLKIQNIDAKTVFLNSTLEDEKFIEQPCGFQSGEHDVCKLNKGIYGLKQASQAWNQFLTKLLLKLGYLRSSVDTCLFYHSKKKSFIVVDVDDIMIFDVDEILVQELNANLGTTIRIDDKGVTEWFLGIKNHVGEKHIILSQERYVKN